MAAAPPPPGACCSALRALPRHAGRPVGAPEAPGGPAVAGGPAVGPLRRHADCRVLRARARARDAPARLATRGADRHLHQEPGPTVAARTPRRSELLRPVRGLGEGGEAGGEPQRLPQGPPAQGAQGPPGQGLPAGGVVAGHRAGVPPRDPGPPGPVPGGPGRLAHDQGALELVVLRSHLPRDQHPRNVDNTACCAGPGKKAHAGVRHGRAAEEGRAAHGV
mmetsp:Transcript_57249/g.183969  ORF Transcript_57249/g.183969 Transcript_57249/m.183969 type:complete len:221 (-) Transcript_57249:268-930(-)